MEIVVYQEKDVKQEAVVQEQDIITLQELVAKETHTQEEPEEVMEHIVMVKMENLMEPEVILVEQMEAKEGLEIQVE